MLETRKLAAVMFTDIVGYTALMSQDEQKALSILQKNRDIQKPLVKKFNGEFLKEMGDGTLLCFQSALDAVNCALEIQQSVKNEPDLNLRIGIHLGDIVFKEGDIYGDGVNVASRIEQLADTGGIYISGQVYSTIKNKPGIEALFLGEKQLKNVDGPVRIYALIGEGLATPSIKPVKEHSQESKTAPFYLKPIILIPLIIVILAATFFLVSRIQNMKRIRWAKDVALPQIEELVTTEGAGVNNIEAYQIAQKAKKYIPEDPLLKQYLEQLTGIITVKTEPEGAKIFRKPFNKTEIEWEYIGESPVDSMYDAIYLFNWKFEKPGYDNLYRQFWSRGPRDWSTGEYKAGVQECVLNREGTVPQDMILIPGTGKILDFLIDKYEVTNKQYRQFMDEGGYRDKSFWKIPFIDNEKEISWEAAMSKFRDATGRQGPAMWEGESYPEREDRLPVNGISWYEAAAYAEFAGKSLPTVDHWGAAKRGRLGMFYHLFFSLCDFGGKGTVPVGTTEAITQFGVYDMAGNVREWCWNQTEKGRCIRGGAWNDVHYMYSEISQAGPFDRSPKNGIRCVIYPDMEKIPESFFAARTTGETRDFYNETPVPDPVFEIYKEMYSYDNIDLNAIIEETDEQSTHWIHQKISFSAAYDNERIIIHLFLPRNATPPYQTVVYFPGSGSVYVPSSDGITEYNEFPFNLSWLIKSGRAVVYPIYKGTFERRDDIPGSTHFLYDDSHEYRDYVIKIVKDFRRVIDYLETRPDIDSEKLAYFGFSWGGIMGSLIPAVEDRIKISIINAGGLEMYKQKTKPEVDHINYVSRVTIPTLMLQGRFDTNVSYDWAAKPMFDLLGTPEKNKKLIVYETDHIIPQKELIKESLDWLDIYFGPVK